MILYVCEGDAVVIWKMYFNYLILFNLNRKTCIIVTRKPHFFIVLLLLRFYNPGWAFVCSASFPRSLLSSTRFFIIFSVLVFSIYSPCIQPHSSFSLPVTKIKKLWRTSGLSKQSIFSKNSIMLLLELTTIPWMTSTNISWKDFTFFYIFTIVLNILL